MKEILIGIYIALFVVAVICWLVLVFVSGLYMATGRDFNSDLVNGTGAMLIALLVPFLAITFTHKEDRKGKK